MTELGPLSKLKVTRGAVTALAYRNVTPEEPTPRWIDLLAALREEHLARLHAVGMHVAWGVVGLAIVVVLCLSLGLEELWDVSFADLELARSAALSAAVLFAAACALVSLGLHQERRDRAAAIAYLDRAIPELLAGREPRAVLTELSERMRRVVPPRFADGEPALHLPSRTDARWLGTRAYTKLCLGCGALLAAALLFAFALALAAPPPDSGEDDYPPPSMTSLWPDQGRPLSAAAPPRQEPCRPLGHEALDLLSGFGRGGELHRPEALGEMTPALHFLRVGA